MALTSRKRAPSPSFYDIESDTLYPGIKEKKSRYEDVCRTCASPASIRNDCIDIFSCSGDILNIHSKINKFLPITVTQNDGLTHLICTNCRDVLNHIDTLYVVCEKADELFNAEVSEDMDVIQEFDEYPEERNFILNKRSPTIQTKIVRYDLSAKKPKKKRISILSHSRQKKEDIKIVKPKTSWITNDKGVDTVILNIEDVTRHIFEDSDIDEFVGSGDASKFDDDTNLHDSDIKKPDEKCNSNISIFNEDSNKSEEAYDDDLKDPDFIPDDVYNFTTASTPKILPIKCNYCKNVYKRGATAVTHYEVHHNMYMCSVCYAHFETNDALVDHRQESHRHVEETPGKVKWRVCKTQSSDKNTESVSCDFNKSEEAYDDDLEDPDFIPDAVYNFTTASTPKSLPIKCNYCKNVYKRGATAVTHYEVHHSMYMCSVCYAHFETNDALVDHRQESHQHVEETPGKVNWRVRKPQSSDKNTESVSCDFCDESFNQKTKLKSHLKDIHQKLMCYKCSQLCNSQTEFEDHLTQEKHGMVCKICHYDCWSHNSWVLHVKDHYSYDTVHVIKPIDEHNESLLELNEITYMIVDKSNDDESEKQTPPQKFPFQCNLCELILLNSTAAFNHYKVHNVHMCSFCYIHFPTKENLKEHCENRHTYSCAICSFKVVSLNIAPLKDHLQTKHDDIASNKYTIIQCGVCNTKFKNTDALQSHTNSVHNRFPCFFCWKCFNDESSYLDHLQLENHDTVLSNPIKKRQLMVYYKPKIQKVTNDCPETFICKLCNVKQSKQFFLKRHYLQFHGKFYCLPCDKAFDSHERIDVHCLKIHGYHTSWQFQCKYCLTYFETEKAVSLHVRTVHEKTIKKFECDHCSKAYRNKERLLQHLYDKHGVEPSQDNNQIVQCHICNTVLRKKKMEIHMKQHFNDQDILCSHCGKLFPNTAKLKKHIKNVNYKKEEKVECPKCLLKIPRHSLEKHQNSEHVFEWSYNCNHCQLQFSTEEDISSHCNTEHGEVESSSLDKPFTRISPYQCDICQTYAANDAKLKLHIYINHKHDQTKIKRVRNETICCEKCGAIVKKKNKSSHDYIVHKIPLKYPCDQCEKSFQMEKKRARHILKVHSKERNFVCDICNKAFITNTTLRSHKRNVHINTYKGLPCPFCDKKFKSIHGQKKHIQMHTANMPYRCEKCDLGFHIKTAYVAHMDRHDKNLPILQPWKRRVEVVVSDVNINEIIND